MVHAWNEPVTGAVDIASWQQFEDLVRRIAEQRGHDTSGPA
jgi:hypothetical protein